MAPTGYAFTLPQLACLHDRETAALQAIKAVQGSHLVGLGQGGIVEDRVTKIFDRPPHAQHRLANVDYLGGAVADDVHPEQFERVGIEDQLQQSLLIAQHLPLGAPYHRDFRNGVDPVRNQIGRHFAGFAEHMTAGQSPLLHRCAGQRRKANDVAGRVDVGYLGLEVLADRDLAALVGAQAGGIDVEQIAVGLASDGVQQRLAVYVLAAFQFGEDPVALRVEADRNHPLPQPKDSAQLPQLKAQALDDLPVHELQQRRALIEQGHLHPQCGEHGRVFQPNNAGAHDDQFPGQLIERVQLVRVEHAPAVDGNILAVRRPRAARNQHMVRLEHLRAFIVHDRDRMGIQKAGIALHHVDVVAPQLRLDDFNLAGHHALRAEDQVRHRNAVFEHVAPPVKGALAKSAQVEHGFAQRLAGNRPCVHAHASDRALAVDDGHLLAKLGRAYRALLPSRPAADNDQIVFVRFHGYVPPATGETENLPLNAK